MEHSEVIECLQKLHTRQLLSMRYQQGWDDYAPDFTEEQLKEVLATREHIPNKIEARKIRQEKAKNKK